MLKNSSFFVFQGNSVFSMIEQAELNRAFFQDLASRAKLFGRHGKPSRAELFCPKARAKTEPSRVSAQTQHYLLYIIVIRKKVFIFETFGLR